MSEAENDQKIVKYGTLKKMFARFAEHMPKAPAFKPSDALVFDEASGRYTNDSIQDWMNAYADGLVYGVEFPKYTHSSSVEAVKTDANEGLILEPSSDTMAGQNDYLEKKLFMCPRVNGGVDADGMPYVTSIEGIDDRFSATEENTWALTPVYYVKRTSTDTHTLNQFSDSPLDGFEECPKARVADGRQRPYILRACYMDSSGDFSSKSGTLPASATDSSLEGYWPHSLQNDFEQARIRNDGLSYLSYADATYQMDFMQLMLGVKAPKSKARGAIGMSGSWEVLSVNTDASVVVASPNDLMVGEYINIGTSGDRWSYPQYCSKARAVRVVDLAQMDEGTLLRFDKAVSPSAGDLVTRSNYRNGSCDGVRGTYGCFDLDGLMSNKAPFRFQNIEWCLGLMEICVDAYNRGGALCCAADVSSCIALDGQTGWTDVCAESVRAGYIGDYEVMQGLLVPCYQYASPSTGYMVHMTCNSFGTVAPYLIGNDPIECEYGGVGSLDLNNPISSAQPVYGTRISALGRSAW